MPYSTGCCTPLANFEATQNYRDVSDPAVVISFPLDDDPKVSFIAWTTTPWTLPSNLALCVHPAGDYVKIKEVSSGTMFIMMEARLASMYKKEEEYEILEKFKGVSLKNKKYKPIFPYFGHLKKSGKEEGAFRVLCDNYVTESSGTGIVHQVIMFYETCFKRS
jgi:isoleucyl-tRNA synthetase